MMKKTLLRYFLAALCLALMALAAPRAALCQAGAIPWDFEYLYLLAPEMGAPVLTGDADQADLRKAGELIHKGRYKEALELLEEMRSKAPSDFLFMINLFEAYANLERASYVGGGTEGFTVSGKGLGPKYLDPRSLAGKLYERYERCCDLSVFRNDAMDQWLQGNGNKDFTAGLMPQPLPPHYAVCEVVADKLPPDLPPPLWAWLHELNGDVLAAHGKSQEAEDHYDAALDAALKAGHKRAAFALLLRKGDLYACPRGDVRAFGWNMDQEGIIRFNLETAGADPYEVDRGDIRAARKMYEKAEDLTQGASELPSYLLDVRYANLARLSREDTAPRLYRTAAVNARKAGDQRTADLMQGSAAILEGDLAAFSAGVDGLLARCDFGAAATLAEMARSMALREKKSRGQGRATLCLLMAADAYEKTMNLREAADAYGELAGLYYGLQLWDTSLNLYIQSLEMYSKWLAMLKKGPPARGVLARDPCRAKCYSPIDDLEDESVNQENLVMKLSDVYNQARWLSLLCGDSFWQSCMPKIEALEKSIGALPAKESREALDETRSYYVQEAAASRLASGLLGCADMQAQLAKLRDSAGVSGEGGSSSFEDLLSPMSRVRMLAIEGKCDPAKKEKARAMLRKSDPFAPIRDMLALKNPWRSSFVDLGGTISEREHSIRFQGFFACQNLPDYLYLAAELGEYDLLEQWLERLEKLIDSHSPPKEYQAMARAKALIPFFQALLAMEKGGDLRKASKLLDKALLPPMEVLEEKGVDFAGDGLVEGMAFPDLVYFLSLSVELGVREGEGYESLCALENLLATERYMVGRLNGLGHADSGTMELAALERDLALEPSPDAQTLARVQELRAEMARSPEAFTTMPEPAKVKAVKKAVKNLPKNVVLLAYYKGPFGLEGFRASAEDGVRALNLARDPYPVFEAANEFPSKIEYRNEEWKKSSRYLYEKLIEPLGPLPPGATLVIMAPGPLASLPFDALGPDAGSLLVRQHPIVYTDRILGEKRGGPGRPPLTGALVMANSELENGFTEAKEVASKLGVSAVDASRADKDGLAKTIAASGCVHIATHGSVEKLNPLRSFVTLRGNRGAPPKDRLEAWWLSRNASSARLVVLSACSTHQGPAPGPILMSLAAGTPSMAELILAGGAENVVASLWLADDALTSKLMGAFYDGIVNGNPDMPKALQQAKLGLGDVSPYYFAPFILSVPSLESLE